MAADWEAVNPSELAGDKAKRASNKLGNMHQNVAHNLAALRFRFNAELAGHDPE